LFLLAKTTGSSISILITYIVFVTKMQKGQTLEKGFTPYKKTISQIFKIPDICIFTADSTGLN